ncbi:GerAB/ArcD/ProY family transporter [Paenibacillus sp. MWE-103]|uniref:GerAB/ArcD/ProY family transporter n=1 Tax=Paenibacillus artemisiicola TaxID=1172618 RepID=A0ABS3W3J7_9BACL|nr:GerAB/ArcD/ProY family transporter [Paenibacillus artemisiicola]
MFKNMQVPLAFFLMHTGMMFFLFPTDIIASTKEIHWLPIVTGLLIQVAIIALYLKGVRYYKGHNMVSVLMRKNRWLAWATFLPLWVYIGALAALTVRAFAEIISIIVSSSMPLWHFDFMFIAIPTYIVLRGGIQGLMRLGLLIAVLFLPSVFFVLAASFQNVDPHYALPLLPRSTADFAFLGHASYYKSLFMFTGCFLFLGLVPSYVSFTARGIYIACGLLVPMYLMSVYIPLMTLGEETASQLEFPFIFTADTIDIEWLMFDRVTMFLVLGLLAFILLFIAALIWQMENVFRLSVRNVRSGILLPALAAVLFVVCLVIPDWKSVNAIFRWHSYLWGYVTVVTPLVVFAVGRRYVGQPQKEAP